jgi:hypothetical protein
MHRRAEYPKDGIQRDGDAGSTRPGSRGGASVAPSVRGRRAHSFRVGGQRPPIAAAGIRKDP